MGHDHYSSKFYITDPVSRMKRVAEYGSSQTVVLMEMLKTRDCRIAGFYVSTLTKRNAMIDFRAIFLEIPGHHKIFVCFLKIFELQAGDGKL